MQGSTLTSADSACRLLRVTDAWARLKTCLSLLFTAAWLRFSQSPWNTNRVSWAFWKEKKTKNRSHPLKTYWDLQTMECAIKRWSRAISSGSMCECTCVKLGVSCKFESRWSTPQEISTSSFTSFICRASCANNTHTNVTYNHRHKTRADQSSKPRDTVCKIVKPKTSFNMV